MSIPSNETVLSWHTPLGDLKNSRDFLLQFQKERPSPEIEACIQALEVVILQIEECYLVRFAEEEEEE